MARVAAAAFAIVLVAIVGIGWARSTPPPALPARAPVGPHPAVRIVVVGDTMLGDAAAGVLAREGYDYPLRALGGVVAGHDLLVGNLEAPVTTGGAPIDDAKAYLYRMEPAALDALAAFGFDLFNLANNHVLDYGSDGLADTLLGLDARGVGWFGLSAGEGDGTAVVRVGALRVGFAGFMAPYPPYSSRYDYFAADGRPGVLPLEEAVVRRALADLRGRADVVIAWVHWGENYAGVTHEQRRWARRLAEWGADAVVGHHPHIAQGVEVIGGVPVLYSLGNFAFGSPGRFDRVDPLERYGLVATLVIEEGRVAAVELVPIEVDNDVVAFQPRQVSAEVAAQVIAHINEPFGTRMAAVAGRAILELR